YSATVFRKRAFGRILIPPPSPRSIPSPQYGEVGRGSGRGEILPPIKAPNTKLETTKKLQVPSSKAASLRQVLEFEVWNFSGAWCLGFGISFSHLSPSAHPCPFNAPLYLALSPPRRERVFGEACSKSYGLLSNCACRDCLHSF